MRCLDDSSISEDISRENIESKITVPPEIYTDPYEISIKSRSMVTIFAIATLWSTHFAKADPV